MSHVRGRGRRARRRPVATSATCRCAPGAGWPRRCAAPASRSTSATSTPACSPRSRADPPGCVVPLLHGATGEDGAIREVLELLGLPYVGAGPAAVPDRPSTSRSPRPSCAAAGVAPRRRSRCRTRRSASWARPRCSTPIVARLGLPLMVKPTRGGSALGAPSCAPPPTCPRRWSARFAYGDVALIERSSTGTEVAVSVIDDGDGPARCRRSRSCPTAALRLRRPLHRRQPPSSSPRPGSPTTSLAECAAVALCACTRSLGLRDLSRTDLIVDADGVAWFLEVNVAPGMTETSTVPQAVAAAGLDLGAVTAQLVERAIERG